MTEKQLEQMISDCLPGGYNCDPQAVADSMREWHAKYAKQEKDWKSKYMDVADAITRESSGVEDLCAQARQIRRQRDEWERIARDACESEQAMRRRLHEMGIRA